VVRIIPPVTGHKVPVGVIFINDRSVGMGNRNAGEQNHGKGHLTVDITTIKELVGHKSLTLRDSSAIQKLYKAGIASNG